MKGSKYSRDAFLIVLEGLDWALRSAAERNEGKESPVRTDEMLAGIADFCVDAYGLLAHAVLDEVGILDSLDIGWIVEDLAKTGAITRDKHDVLYDFILFKSYLRGWISEGMNSLPTIWYF